MMKGFIASFLISLVVVTCIDPNAISHNLTWQPNALEDNVIEYIVYRDKKEIGRTTETSFDVPLIDGQMETIVNIVANAVCNQSEMNEDQVLSKRKPRKVGW